MLVCQTRPRVTYGLGVFCVIRPGLSGFLTFTDRASARRVASAQCQHMLEHISAMHAGPCWPSPHVPVEELVLSELVWASRLIIAFPTAVDSSRFLHRRQRKATQSPLGERARTLRRAEGWAHDA